jgi:hypothetical protein
MTDPDEPEGYSDEEAQRRFEIALRAALNTPPQPIKERPRQPRKKKAAKPFPKPLKPSSS